MKAKKRILYHYFGTFLTLIGLLFFFVFFLFIFTNMGDVGSAKLMQSPVFIIVNAALLLIVPVLSVIVSKNQQKAELVEYICRSALRYVIAFLMFFYGYVKMYHKFFEITYLAQDTRLADVDSFSLVWYFFGRSNVQEFLIGLLEFVPALLLLFRRTSFLAYILLLPVVINVLIVNIFNHVSGLTFPLSVFIVLANFYLLYGHKEAIVTFLKNHIEKAGPVLNKGLNITRWSFKILIFGSIFFLVVLTLWGNFFRKEKNYTGRNKFTGGFELYELRVNDSIIHPDTGNTAYYKSIYIEPQSRWNCILTFETIFHPHAITIKWNAKNDSVYTYLKKDNSVTTDAVDSSTVFTGIYQLKGNMLLIDGMQYGKTIRARYRKKDLTDYKWFW